MPNLSAAVILSGEAEQLLFSNVRLEGISYDDERDINNTGGSRYNDIKTSKDKPRLTWYRYDLTDLDELTIRSRKSSDIHPTRLTSLMHC